VNRFVSVFSQLLQLFSRLDFQRAVKETNAERHARGFTCWGQFVAMLFGQLLTRCQAVAAGRRTFRFKNTLASRDASVIDLCATLFDWATFRRTTGAVKLHLLLDHDGVPAQLCRDHRGPTA